MDLFTGRNSALLSTLFLPLRWYLAQNKLLADIFLHEWITKQPYGVRPKPKIITKSSLVPHRPCLCSLFHACFMPSLCWTAFCSPNHFLFHLQVFVPTVIIHKLTTEETYSVLASIQSTWQTFNPHSTHMWLSFYVDQLRCLEKLYNPWDHTPTKEYLWGLNSVSPLQSPYW